jgi:hypothetical protein
MTTKRKFLSYVLFVIGVVILTGTIVYYLHTRQPVSDNMAENVPEIVANHPLVQVVTGQEAIDRIHQLHGKDFPMDGGVVAVYGNQNAILWVSDAGSVPDAVDLTELMKDHIAAGNSPFIELGDFNLDGLNIYALDGMGQAHYYWQSGKLVLWLAADVSVAQQSIIECVDFYK